MDELGSWAVNAVNINPIIGSGSKAAGKWVEMKESCGEGVFEAMKKGNHKKVFMVGGLCEREGLYRCTGRKENGVQKGLNNMAAALFLREDVQV
uniref:Uncharacterized protein n=1 Tax=Cucumis sativus TaxID=3659 RepID=A0A0A0L3M7_CUCSA